MKKKAPLFLGLIILTVTPIFAQQGSDIYLFDFKMDESFFSLSNPQNITSNVGYDNQPHFLPDGKSLYYSADDGFGQTDIYRYYLSSDSERRITYSPGSEYSPIPTPDGDNVSCIILEQNGTQKLWKYRSNGGLATLVSDLEPVGYHVWYGADKLGLFILDDQNKLVVHDLASDTSAEVDKNIGRTLLRIPGTNHVSYVKLKSDENWIIMRLNMVSMEKSEIIKSLPGSQDYTWSKDGIMLSGDGERLFKFNPATDATWVEIANLKDYGLNTFNRLALSPDGTKLAMVVNEAKLPDQ